MKISRRDARSPTLSKEAARTVAVFLCAGLFVGPGVQSAAAGPVARQTYTLSEFDTVRLEAPLEVVIATGKGVSAYGTGDRDTLDQLDLQINSRTLVIRLRNSMMLGGSGGKVRLPTRITLTTGELHRITVQGAGNLTADALKGPHVTASLNGSGRLVVAHVDTDRIDTVLIGSGTVTLAGKTLDLMATVSGSGRLDASALDAQRVRAETEGSIEARLSAREEAIATSNGSGELVITGKTKCTVRKTGSASVTCGGAVY
ncbi:MAG TPA: DUF2807 domain-containing protein [Sphingobium sp.]|uniref:GIN domain-containing protein n=1 Tax=Sphingobium sp. TaxID=1912891 RepID=UPI002ED37D4D